MYKINVIKAKHEGCNKEFFFSVTDDQKKKIQKGDILLVDTKRGIKFATALCDPFTLEDEAINLLLAAGAYFPLKPVIEYCGNEMRSYIICQYLKSALKQEEYNCPEYLPF